MNPDWINGLIGGLLIGLAAASFLLLNGRIMGASGILSGLLNLSNKHWRENAVFVIGLIGGPMIYAAIVGPPEISVLASYPGLLIVGGFLVGFGAKLGGGCTSGHGVCGMARFSKRSIVATCVFMASAAFVSFFMIHIIWASI